jgi:hypothetical protein
MPREVASWTCDQYTAALRHDQTNKAYNQSFRQLLHVGFKIAAKIGDRYLLALERNEEVVAKNVTTNLFDRHIRPVFIGSELLLQSNPQNSIGPHALVALNCFSAADTEGGRKRVFGGVGCFFAGDRNAGSDGVELSEAD